MKKREIIFYPDKCILEIAGKKYIQKSTKYKKIDGVEHIDKVIFTEYDSKEIKEKEEYIKNRLSTHIDTEEVIKEVTKQMDVKGINKLFNLLKKKDTVVKKQSGCLGLKIDGGKRNNMYIQVFE